MKIMGLLFSTLSDAEVVICSLEEAMGLGLKFLYMDYGQWTRIVKEAFTKYEEVSSGE